MSTIPVPADWPSVAGTGIRMLTGVGLVHVSPRTVKLASDPSALALRAAISTADVDRAGDVIVSTGLRNVAEYLSNPVVLWAHQYTLPPIGTCLALEIQPDRVVAETRFAQGVAFAEELFQLYEQGVLRGWSIGFVPLRAERMPATDGGGPRGLRVEEWDLLEYSAVPVPENPGALTLAMQKGLVRDALLRRCLAQVPDDPGGRWWRAWPAADAFARLIVPPTPEPEDMPAGAD
jgi:phage head maturation protease